MDDEPIEIEPTTPENFEQQGRDIKEALKHPEWLPKHPRKKYRRLHQ